MLAFDPAAPPASPADLAKPKSRILTTPAGVSLMFAGFKSRGMIPRSCAASNPAAIWRAMERASSSGKGALEVGALHQFHHQGALLDAIHGRDVGMVLRSQHLRFTLEARRVLGIVGQRRGEHLDGKVAIELGVAGAVLGPAQIAWSPACQVN